MSKQPKLLSHYLNERDSFRFCRTQIPRTLECVFSCIQIHEYFENFTKNKLKCLICQLSKLLKS